MSANNEPTELSHLNPARLSRLWPTVDASGDEVAVDGTISAWLRLRPEEMGDVLKHQLSVCVEDGTRKGPALVRLDPPWTFGQLLTDPNPPLPLLESVKAMAKPAMMRSDGDLPREVAGIMYYGAIFAARLRCGQSISKLPISDLSDAARWALRRPWLTEPLASLFREGLQQLSAQPPGATQ